MKRFPRWDCLPLSQQEKEELRKGLIEAGVALALP